MINLFDGKYLYRIFFLKKIFLVVFRKFKTKSLLTIFIFSQYEKNPVFIIHIYILKKNTAFIINIFALRNLYLRIKNSYILYLIN